MIRNVPNIKVMLEILLITLLLIFDSTHAVSEPIRPNIVFVVADDLGWDDVSFHGSPQVPTPNIDALALSGVILNNYYVSPSSFATKSEFMTGKYATRLGVQHGVLHNKQPTGLPYEEKILPQYLKEMGYRTHAIGKWGLGFFTDKMLPWNRGFDSFYGGLTSSSRDYFTHSAYDDNYGLDLRRNDQVVHNETGHYATELYTEEAVNIIKQHDSWQPLFLYVSHQAVHSGNADDPLQVPPSYLNKLKHIRNHKRKLYAGMVLALDESILNITTALADRGMMSNTIFIFTTDGGGGAGGMELSAASNFPLRGSKLTVWEGGVRGASFVYSDLLNEKARVNEEMFHSTDWFPTILNIAGADWKRIRNLDGYNVWDAISSDGVISPRFEILHQYDPLSKNQCALRVGDYKIILNQDIGFYGDWYPRPAAVGELVNLTTPATLPNAQVKCDKNYPHPFLEMHAPPCDSMRRPCLFNIQWDPCEFHNLAEFMPNTLKVLLDRLQYYRGKVRRPHYPSFDQRADPENNDGVWGPWIKGNENTTKGYLITTTAIPLVMNISTQAMMNAQNQEYMVSAMTQAAPVVMLATDINVEPHKETPRWEQELSTRINETTLFATEAPLTVSTTATTTAQVEHNISLALPNDTETSFKEFVNVVTDQGDKVGMVMKDRNGSRIQEQEYAHIGDEFIDSGEGKTRFNMNGKTTGVTIVSNQTAENPIYTQALMDDLNSKKNSSMHTSSISDDTISYSNTKDVTTQNQQTMIYMSGPATPNAGNNQENQTSSVEKPGSENKVMQPNGNYVENVKNMNKTVIDNVDIGNRILMYNGTNVSINNNTAVTVPNETVPNKTPVAVNDTTANETTGEEKPQATAAHVQQEFPPAPPASITQPQPAPNPVVPPLSPAQPNAPFNKPSTTNVALPPAVAHPPPNAALRPNQNAPPPAAHGTEQKALSMGTGSETTTSTVSEANSHALTGTTTDSKLPALQNPHVLATLNSLADAGDNNKNPGKQGLSSEVAIAAGQEIRPGSLPAQNFIKEPKYAQVEKPVFEKPQNPFADMGGAGEKAASSTSSSAGSETESETVVGAGAQTGSDTKIGQKPKLISDNKRPTPQEELKESAVAKEIGNNPTGLVDATTETDSFIKTRKPNLASSLKAMSSHAPLGKGAEFSLNHEDHNLPNAVVAGNRPFQSLSDVIKDSGRCTEGRSCVEYPPGIQPEVATNAKPISNNSLGFASIKEFESKTKLQSVSSGSSQNNIGGTEATSNAPLTASIHSPMNKTANNFEELPGNEKLHKFFGQIKVDNKKLFYISGAASEDRDLVYPPNDSSGLVTQNDVRKHNIGFNVMLPSNVVKQVGSPKFKERSKVESSTPKIKKIHISEKHLTHPKNKSSIKKVFDMIADRTRKTKVEIPPVIEEHEITSKTNIATISGEEQHGDTGDIGATKPLKGTLIESKAPEVSKSTITNDTNPGTETANLQASKHANTEAGDLGSIVTLVGKVKVDRLNSKRMKHNNSEERNAHKKTVKEHMSVKHMQPNNTETNAANVDQISGPSNSIIVSSVIVVLIASFIVVGMAVVAIVAVVARHCRLGKQLSAS